MAGKSCSVFAVALRFGVGLRCALSPVCCTRSICAQGPGAAVYYQQPAAMTRDTPPTALVRAKTPTSQKPFPPPTRSPARPPVQPPNHPHALAPGCPSNRHVHTTRRCAPQIHVGPKPDHPAHQQHRFPPAFCSTEAGEGASLMSTRLVFCGLPAESIPGRAVASCRNSNWVVGLVSWWGRGVEVGWWGAGMGGRSDEVSRTGERRARAVPTL